MAAGTILGTPLNVLVEWLLRGTAPGPVEAGGIAVILLAFALLLAEEQHAQLTASRAAALGATAAAAAAPDPAAAAPAATDPSAAGEPPPAYHAGGGALCGGGGMEVAGYARMLDEVEPSVDCSRGAGGAGRDAEDGDVFK